MSKLPTNYKIYPVTIVSDRYGGAYSGAQWLAFNKYDTDLPSGFDGGDGECMTFWEGGYKGTVGKGKTPDEAYEDLKEKCYLERT